MALERPTVEQIADASKEELANLAADCLEQLEPGRQTLELFKQIARIMPLPGFEIVPLNNQPDSLKILLNKRPFDDEWWPNKWALPGGIILQSDKTGGDWHERLTKRILEKDFKGTVVPTSETHKLGNDFREHMRGKELTALGWVEVELVPDIISPVGGAFFDVELAINEPLEGGLVDGHAEIIQKALAEYSS